jgi:hypothetical protein
MVKVRFFENFLRQNWTFGRLFKTSWRRSAHDMKLCCSRPLGSTTLTQSSISSTLKVSPFPLINSRQIFQA